MKVSTINQFYLSFSLIRCLNSRSLLTIAIAIGALAGIHIGINDIDLASTIEPIGIVYLSLLKICVIPILFCLVATSIARLVTGASNIRSKIFVVFPAAMFLVSAIAVLIAILLFPQMGLFQQTFIGSTVSVENVDSSIFNLEIVLASSIVGGIFLGSMKKSPITKIIFSLLSKIYKTFSMAIDYLNLFLPLALCSLLANQLSRIGIDGILRMFHFVVIALATYIIMYCLSTIVVWLQTKQSLFSVLSALKEPTFLAVATTSSLVCLPASISALTRLNFKADDLNLAVPISIGLCRFGNVVYFAIASVFVVSIYEIDLGAVELITIVLGSIVAGIATAGTTGILTLTMLGLVLGWLSIPLAPVIGLFVAIDPLIDPFRTLTIVNTAMAATAVVSAKN